MKKYLPYLIGAGIILTSVAYAAVLNSNQVGTSPVNGYYLQTNGATSTWAAVAGGGAATTTINGAQCPVFTFTPVVTSSASSITTSTCTIFFNLLTLTANSPLSISATGTIVFTNPGYITTSSVSIGGIAGNVFAVNAPIIVSATGTIGLSTPLASAYGGTATTTALGLCAFSNSCGSGLSSYAVSVATANGVSATAATTTTSTALTFSLGAITPSTVNGLALNVNSDTSNVSIGTGALGYMVSTQTVAIGAGAGDPPKTGGTITNDVFIGYHSASNNNLTTGANQNTFIGDFSGQNLSSGANNILLGYAAGKYITTNSNSFYVNNIDQTNTAGDKAYSLLYGNFSGVAATTTGQFLDVNGHLGSATSTVSVTSCGTGSPTVTGSDNGGVITAGTVATTCTLNFASVWNYAPSCVVTSRTASIAVGYGVTTSTLVVTNSVLNGDVVDYHCYGNPN